MNQIPLEPQSTYSNRSYWYPQATVTDYATAKMTLTVPGDFDVVASGTRPGLRRCCRAGGSASAEEVRVRDDTAAAIPRVS